MRRLLLAFALLFAPLPGRVPAVAAGQSSIAVTDAWSRPAMVGRIGIVYLTIIDSGAPDRLIGARSPVAAKASLHQSINDHGVMKMRPVAVLPVQPGTPLKLSPDGYHIMLEGLKQPLEPGQTFPVTLTFAHAGAVTATAIVQKAGGGMAMSHASMGGMNMQGSTQPATGMSGMDMGSSPKQ
jgi:periplasmic copper chaperone A